MKLTLGVSITIGLVLGLFASLGSGNGGTPAIRFTLGAAAYGAVFLLLNAFVLPYVRATSRARVLVLQALVSIVAMALASFVLVNTTLLLEFGVWMLSTGADGEYVARLSWAYFALPILPLGGLAVVLFNQAWLPMRALEARAQRADELAASAELQALRAQIDPHFLFNSLNSIAHLITTDPARAEECVQRLAEIFRYLLSSKDRSFVTLADELEIADGYLDIERARFGKQLEVSFDVDERARSWIVPTLIVQPLVENAVRHGISKKVGGGTVEVHAHIEGNELVVDVHDTGAGMESGTSGPRGTGVGLRNVTDRLTHLYGGGYLPHINSTPGEGTRVRLRVPDRALTSDAG